MLYVAYLLIIAATMAWELYENDDDRAPITAITAAVLAIIITIVLTMDEANIDLVLILIDEKYHGDNFYRFFLMTGKILGFVGFPLGLLSGALYCYTQS